MKLLARHLITAVPGSLGKSYTLLAPVQVSEVRKTEEGKRARPRTDLVIETRALTKRFRNGYLAVDGINMHVPKGAVYGFLGPNGAGKTTTLRILAGLTQPSSGSARVTGQALGSPISLARTGCLVESPAFYPYLSGVDNLQVIAAYAGVPQSRIEDALDLVELTSRGKDKYHTYSLGMKQRLGLAAATLKDPALLILDEPTNGLDPQGMADMRQLIKEIAAGGRTVLISSHLLSEVEQMCSHAGIIQRGRLIAEGTIEELREGPELVEIKAEPLGQTESLLQRMLGPDSFSCVDGTIRVRMETARAAELNRALVLAGVDVSRLLPVQPSLEETFLRLTGGESGL
jgi:ABC-type multidrug transport system ATPase subunit